MTSSENDNEFRNRKVHLSGLIQKLNSRKSNLQKLSAAYSNFRLIIFVFETVLFFLLFFAFSNLSALISAGIFIVIFSIITHFHNKLDNGIRKLELWIKIKSTNLARLNLDWGHIPAIKYSDNAKFSHNIGAIETDLNLAGDESLHQLINTGTSHQAKSLLRDWLNIKDPSTDDIVSRQKLVKDLVPLSGFRDKLILYSTLSSGKDFDGNMLSKLLSKKVVLSGSFKLIFGLLIILAPINILLFLLFLENILPAYWGITTLIYIALFHFNNKEKDKILNEAEFISDELEKIGSVFKYLEEYNYKAPNLRKLCEPFKMENERPSVLISKIKSAVDFLRIRKGNPFVWNMIRAGFPIDLYFRFRLNKYKYLVAGKFIKWLEAWYNLEALSSLANFAFLNPEYTFPEIIETKESKIIFSGTKLGHPLIKKENKICNDFSFNPNGEIAIITGSNMSGKSTFIRTLGVNLSLAYAGSVVNAEELKISLLRLFTCIKVSDSVVDGISYFYAEVKRLKGLLDQIERSVYPVLFLIDEIFRGTNNVERLKGSTSYIKKLAETDSLGAIATHDLELVKLSEEIHKVRNYHFKEDIKNGRMLFDFRLNKGPCPTTNALKIMKLEGLPVE